MKTSIVLASGGLDSSVLVYYLKNKGLKTKLLFFNYNQKSLKQELFCVKNLAKNTNSELKIINLDWLGEISTSFINQNKSKKDEIINWYVPCRNSIFILAGLAHAESEFIETGEKQDVYIGIKYEGELQFKDTTPAFLKSVNNLSKKSVQKGDFKILAPFIDKDKEDIIELGRKLNVNFNETCSCYVNEEIKNKKPVHCGKCSGCKARKKGFRFSNVKDKTLYQN